MGQICVGLTQHDDGIIPSTWLLLDTRSTSSVVINPDMSKNILSRWGMSGKGLDPERTLGPPCTPPREGHDHGPGGG